MIGRGTISMSAKVFVDTNILVYAHDLSAGAKHERARDLVASLWQDETGCLSLQVMQEFYILRVIQVFHLEQFLAQGHTFLGQ